MDQTGGLTDFFDTVAEDPRIGSAHIVIYLALLNLWQVAGRPTVLLVATYEMLRFTGIRKRDTYLQRIRELADYGYIVYQPAENEHVKAEVSFKRLV